MDFTELSNTIEDHWKGSLLTYNDKLTVIAGWRTLTVEVLENPYGDWDASRIHLTPEEFKLNIRLHSLVVTDSGTDSLFIFGKLLKCQSFLFKFD